LPSESVIAPVWSKAKRDRSGRDDGLQTLFRSVDR
jgi:hypothetical protein